MTSRTLAMIVLGAVVMLSSGCTSAEMTATRQLPITRVDLSQARDGSYDGEYTYGRFTYRVEVVILDHRIVTIRILDNRNTRRALMAEGVVDRILQSQRNDVDAVSGATTTSKALLKATENALTRSLASP
ncbi:MAG TPA: FMN-binding protein [Spirochaetia bacterium]|nr:FMN-binding protein [Spirochaetia bacterium]